METMCMSQHNTNHMHRICYVLYNSDVIMSTMVSQITILTIFYPTVHSDGDQRKHQSSAALTFGRRIHRSPVNSPHKVPVTRKMFPFDDVNCILHFVTCFDIGIDPLMSADCRPIQLCLKMKYSKIWFMYVTIHTSIEATSINLTPKGYLAFIRLKCYGLFTA